MRCQFHGVCRALLGRFADFILFLNLLFQRCDTLLQVPRRSVVQLLELVELLLQIIGLRGGGALGGRWRSRRLLGGTGEHLGRGHGHDPEQTFQVGSTIHIMSPTPFLLNPTRFASHALTRLQRERSKQTLRSLWRILPLRWWK